MGQTNYTQETSSFIWIQISVSSCCVFYWTTDVKCLLFPGVQEVFCRHVSRLHPVDRSLLLPDGVVGSSGLFTCLHPVWRVFSTEPGTSLNSSACILWSEGWGDWQNMFSHECQWANLCDVNGDSECWCERHRSGLMFCISAVCDQSHADELTVWNCRGHSKTSSTLSESHLFSFLRLDLFVCVCVCVCVCVAGRWDYRHLRGDHGPDHPGSRDVHPWSDHQCDRGPERSGGHGCVQLGGQQHLRHHCRVSDRSIVSLPAATAKRGVGFLDVDFFFSIFTHLKCQINHVNCKLERNTSVLSGFSLPVPWLLFTLLHNGEPVTVSSNGLFCAIVLLFLMLLFVIISIGACRWKMSKMLGFTMFVLYFVFLVLSVMLEDRILICPISIWADGQRANPAAAHDLVRPDWINTVRRIR